MTPLGTLGKDGQALGMEACDIHTALSIAYLPKFMSVCLSRY
jgi:hypothetical protein